eukprot:TRINITY_DN5927_c0_g1_i2.p1 TRINITY_DN5927_c0_g1~~TRINITY_DN5927_c0_g1_i2.p1  ORF type:complete len:222 (-),score=60.18 TRINITY_DN5927_c0_g1_i2:20-685(-)
MHRFYAAYNRPDSALDPDMVVAAVLYLAGKAEECTRKIRDVINVVHYGRHKQGLAVDEEFWSIRREVLAIEQGVCRALNFDYDVELPYCIVLAFAHSTQATPEFSQLCCTFLNDSVLLPSYVEHEPTAHAAAAIHTAGAVLGQQQLPGHNQCIHSTTQLAWWQAFGVSRPELETISCAVLKFCLLYTSDAADEEDSVVLGGCRIIQKKKNERKKRSEMGMK